MEHFCALCSEVYGEHSICAVGVYLELSICAREVYLEHSCAVKYIWTQFCAVKYIWSIVSYIWSTACRFSPGAGKPAGQDCTPGNLGKICNG